ncbi:MAG: leucine-rich repeat protein [Mogibacterium sp.]|nr:leucine-rich repeat protein [Mogibacterium sp.]
MLLALTMVLTYMPGLAFAATESDGSDTPKAAEEAIEPEATGPEATGPETPADEGDEPVDPGRWNGEAQKDTITVNETKEVTIGKSRDYVSFEFKPTVSGWYNFKSDGEYDTYGRVLDADQNELAMSDDGSGVNGDNFNVLFEAEAGETYYLQAAMYGTDTGEFTVELVEGEEPAVDQGKWSGQKYSDTISLEETKNVDLENVRDYASFEFTAPKDGWYSFSSSGGEDTYGRVLDSDEYLLDEDDDIGNGDYNFEIVFQAEAGKKYYLEACFLDPETGSFSVFVTETTEPSGGGDDDDDDDANWGLDYTVTSYGAGRTFSIESIIEEYGQHGTLTGYWYRTQNGQIIEEDVDNPIATGVAGTTEYDSDYAIRATLPVDWKMFRLEVVETDADGNVVARKTDTYNNTYEYEPAPGDNVDSATFVPAQPINLKYREDGSLETIYDEDSNERIGRYFKYSFPGFQEGDKLVVEYNDGKGTVEYEYRENTYNEETGESLFDDYYEYHFVNPADETGKDVIGFDYRFEQTETEEWEPNSTHAFTTHVWSIDHVVECPVNIVLDESKPEFEYEAIAGDFVRITRYNGTSKDISIPSTISGKTVQEIGDGVFAGMNITSVTIPDSVEVIGKNAFDFCKSLKSVDLGKGIKTIKDYAFYGCGGVSTFALPGTLTNIGQQAFAKCTGVTSFSLPDSITEIGSEAFAGIPGLKTVNYPKSLQSTGGDLFKGDEQITSFVVPEGVTTLASYVFMGCSYLTNVTLPTSMTKIGTYAFYGCSALEHIDLPFELTTINGYAFYDCDKLSAVQIPDTVTFIGSHAFADCAALSSINYPMSLDSTGGYLLDNTPNVKEITVPDGVLSLASSVFSGSSMLTKVNLPEGLKVIESQAFYENKGLKTIELPDSVEEFGSSVFAGCTSLTSINYPASLKKCSWSVWTNTPKLKSITVPDGVTVLPKYAFEDADGLVTVVLPDSLETIGDQAFQGCSSLRNIDIPDGVSSIGEDAFYNCTSLVQIKIPASTVSLPWYVFGECTKLEGIWIGAQVTSIDSNAFKGCNKEILVIHGVEGSYAQTWAADNGFQFSSEELVIDDSSFSGKVEDANGNGIEGIGVVIYDDLEGRVVARVYTDASGEWTSTDIVKGRQYTITYSRANYRFSANDFKETAGGAVVIDTVTAEEIISGLVEPSASDFTYEIMNGNDIRITGYTGTEEKISIPSAIGEYSVVSIGESAFTANKLTAVVIPEGVTSIEEKAFYDCSKLTAVLLPSTLTSIGTNAFHRCTGLSEISLPFGLQTIYSSAFSNCTGLKAIHIPDSVTTIGSYAFDYCTGLESANYPLAIQSAGSGIFDECTKLTSFTVPDGVTELADSFFSMSEVTEVILPDSLKVIGQGAFRNCSKLTSITLPASLETIQSTAFMYCTGLKTIEFPETLKEIGGSAFYGCTGLTAVHIPDGVTSIGGDAFASCSALEEFNYPLSLESGGSGILSGDTKITEITVPEGVTKLADYAFAGCNNLTKINLPESLTEIGRYAFEYCTGLTEIVVPDSVTVIGSRAFYGCTGLTEFKFPTALTKINSYAFSGCTGLTAIELPDTVTFLGERCFSECTNLEQANYPASLEKTDGSVFAYDTKLKEMSVPEGVTVLAEKAFYGCRLIETIHLPDSLREIGPYAFNMCSSLTNIEIPSGVTKIGDYAFQECESLKGSIEVPESVTELGKYAFDKCSGIEEIRLPDGLKSIGSYAFANCTSLRSINYPVSVETIGGALFTNDSSLKSITVPEGVTALPEYAFGGASFLTEVSLPSTLTSIGRNAFYGCSGLTSITLPDSVETIGDNAFHNCTNLTSFGYPKSLKTCGTYMFTGDAKLRSITIPEGVTELPQNVFDHADKLVTVRLPKTLTKIGDSAFYQATSLKKVIIPDSVTTIEQHAFNGCESLVKMIIPASVTEIAYRVFRYNTSLEAIWIGEQVTSINNGAFDSCDKNKLVIHGVAGSYANTWATSNGYAFQTDEVVIEDNEITGVVNDSEGKGLEGVHVTIFDDAEGTKAFTCNTDGDGRWECTELTSGKKYTVSYGMTNYTFSNNQIKVEAGVDSELDPVTAEKVLDGLTVGDAADFTYEAINGNEIKITGYTGSAKKLQIPEVIDDLKVTMIGSNAFGESSKITQLAIPESVTQIQSSAFYNNSSITQVLLPSTLETLGGSVFEGCTSLETIDLPYGLKRIEYESFRYSGLKSISFPDTVLYISSLAFADCSNLERIDYPMGVLSTDTYVFHNDPKLTMVEVPEGVTYIAEDLFNGCNYLTSIVLPESLKKINSTAFADCDGLTSVRIPDGVTTFGYGVFSGCDNLAMVNYPASLTSCSSAPFGSCGKLKTIAIPDGVKRIVKYSLSSIDGLTEVVIPDSVEAIDERALNNCKALKTIQLPSSLKTVGQYAFSGCEALLYAIYPGTEEEWNAYVTIGDYNTELANALVFNGGQGQITAPVAPDLYGEAYGHKQARLVWDYTGDTSLVKRYVIYRSENGINYNPLRSVAGTSYEYIDKLSFTGGSKTYFYKITVFDKYDRSKDSQPVRVDAVSTDHEAPNAVISPGKNAYVRTGDECNFSGAMSTDNDAIASYRWTFSDGTRGSGKNIKHMFTSTGTYTVTLEVTDVNGNTGTTTVQITAIDPNDPNYTMLKLTVCNAENKDPIKGAQVSITRDEATDTFESDNNGQVIQIVKSGDYVISAAANGFMPRTVKIVAEGGIQESTLGLATKNIMSGSITVEEMTYDEIVAAGIDVNAPGNGHVYEFETHLTFVAGIQTYDFPINIFKNEKGEIVKTTGGGFRNIGDPYTPGGEGFRLGIFPITEKFVLVIYGEVHWLKEMYKVELVVNNNSSTDTLEDIHGELILPDGMSLADMVSGAQTADHDMGSLGYNSSTSTEWYIRGDKEGEYNIKARVTATSMPYGEVLEQIYETATPVKVYAGSALKLTITCPDQAERGKTYKVKYKLENVSDKHLYNLSFGITGSKQYKVVGFGDKEAWLPITSSSYGAGWTRKVDDLAPGGYVQLELETTIWFNSALELVAFSKLGAFIDVAYYLTDVSMVTAETNTTDIPYEIVVERAERPNLIDKVLPDGLEKFLEKFGIEFPGDSLGGTLIEWFGEDVLGMESASGAKTWLKLAQGSTESTLTVEIDDGRGEKDSIENDVVRVSSGSVDQQIVDILNGNKIKTGVDGVTITAKGPGTSRLKIGVENKFGELEREYTVDYVVNGHETKTTTTVGFNETTKKYVCEEDNFEETITAHRNMEIQEYLKNPFQKLDDTLTIDVTGHTKDTNYTVQLTGKQIDDLLEGTTVDSLDIKGNIANMSYSREALTTLSTKGGTVDFTAEKLTYTERQALGTTNPVYRFTANTTADPRWDYSGGPVTITVDYEIVGEENQKNVQIRHIKEDGSEEILPATYNPKYKTITFKTNSFSYFEILAEGGHDNAEEAETVATLISDLPAATSVKLSDSAQVKAALEAYESLTETAKAELNEADVKKLLDAAAKIDSLEKAEAAKIKANHGKIDTKLPKVTIYAPKAGKKYLTAKWKKLTAAQKKKVKGIEVEYSTSKTFKTAYKFKTVSKTAASTKISKLKSKKYYYVRVHTYVIRNGVRYVSPWSKVKKIRVK